MGREVRRVPLDFGWEIGKVWDGFLSPDELDEAPCASCEGTGYSGHARYLHDLWYGNEPFDPASTGSTPWTAETPAIRQRAEDNVTRAPEFYLRPRISWSDPYQHEADIAAVRAMSQADLVEEGTVREAERLAAHFNSWSHHLSQDDVDALVEGDRLYDFTHTWVKDEGWQPIVPTPVVPAAAVNEWSLSGMAHDSINCHVVVAARCKREGKPETCEACAGHGSFEVYPGQRAQAEAWEPTPPPVGEGWQLWETTSEGSPTSPVFATAEELAQWTTENDCMNAGSRMPDFDAALRFVKAGWAPSFVASAATGVVDGAVWVAATCRPGQGRIRRRDARHRQQTQRRRRAVARHGQDRPWNARRRPAGERAVVARPVLVAVAHPLDQAIAEAAAMQERDRAAGGPPWEVEDHPDHKLPGGWHRNLGTAFPEA